MTDSNTLEPQEPDEWADALAEQAAEAGDDDPWAAALAEQEQADAAVAGPAPSVGSSLFKPLPVPAPAAAARELEMIMDIPVKLSVELGRTRITIKQLLELAQARCWRWTAWRGNRWTS